MRVKNKEIEQIMNDYGSGAVPFLFIIDFEGKEAEILTLQQAEQQGILFQTIDFQNYTQHTPEISPFVFKKSPIPYSQYQKAFELVSGEISYGNSYLLNLTFPTPLYTDLSLEDIFHRSRAKFKLLVPDHFVVFSPEIFVRIKGGVISSFPMKGTIDADIDNADDVILSDRKEEAEHNTIVDLIRNDLAKVACNIRVERFRYIDKLLTHQKSLLQVSSQISGDLSADYQHNIGTLITQLLPAGSVSGAPKKKTVEIIKMAESDERGFYTGVFGYFDGFDLDSGVMIRFIEQTPSGLIFRSGGGITCMSSCESEYYEMIDKVYVPFI